MDKRNILIISLVGLLLFTNKDKLKKQKKQLSDFIKENSDNLED